jgi:hypothetical protein
MQHIAVRNTVVVGSNETPYWTSGSNTYGLILSCIQLKGNVGVEPSGMWQSRDNVQSRS